jgi:hypothetical protein
MACVTGAGADGVPPSDLKQAEACETLENAQSPQRRVHALLGGTPLTKSTSSLENAWTRGSKLDWQNDIAKTPADIMTRAQVNDYNYFVTNDATCPTKNIQTSETRQIRKHDLTKH